MKEFVHLHNHSEYSLLDGLLRLSDGGFLPRAAKMGYKAMALTDHGNMYGAMDFYNSARKSGIKPIMGCEAYLCADHASRDKTQQKPYHITLLAKDYEGYKNLMKLVSRAWVDGFYYHPRIDKALLAKHSTGIIALSGCLQGHIPRALLSGPVEESAAIAKEYEDIMGKGNFYLEMMDHGIEDERTVLKRMMELSKLTGIPLVATNDCHYEKQEDWEIHDVHMCISMNKTLNDPERLKQETHELYFKTPEEMWALFDYAPQALTNTLEIAEKCNVEMPKTGFILPHFDIPKEYPDILTYFRGLCEQGLERILGGEIPKEYRDRLEFETDIIHRMGFESYFLIVADFINYARKNSIPVGPGRGSGAGSIVAYSLQITKVDPIKNGLLFERFLNPDRLTMPDLDIDFSDSGRERVIEYVRNKYGSNHVAQIITFGSMKAKLAVKDVARAMGVSVADSNRITKMIPNDLGTTLESAEKQSKELREEIKNNAETKKIFEFAKKLEGIKRHAGIHAAGIVVTREEVSEYSPLARGSKESITTQFEGETLVDLGLLKIDFLGLRTLTIIENTVKLVKELRGVDIDIDKIPLDDKKTYALLTSARTLGIFQLESGGMRDLVKRLKPTQFSDISALVALYRPGPMQSGMLDMFVNRKAGKEKVKYETPLLENILKETYGTMVYQEQIMEISKVLGGFTPGAADTLRKAMGKKQKDVMDKAGESFVQGCLKNNIPKATAQKIFDQMAEFAGYGFNKSHSVAYALVSYQTAYLKANYPIEFMCATLTNEIGHNAIGSEDKENKIVTYIEEARRMGYETLPPDINKSAAQFSVEKADGKEYIRYGLEALKNMGTEAANNIIASRADKPFKDLSDLIERMESSLANKKSIETLAKSGALDCLEPGAAPEQARADFLAQMEDLLSDISKLKQEKEMLSCGLFGEDLANSISVKKTTAAPARALSKNQLLEYEKEVLGFYFSGHPLSAYSRHIKKLKTAKIADIKEKRLSGSFKIAGIITRIKKRLNKRNEEWCQFYLEDETGDMQVNVFSRAYEKTADKITAGEAVILRGEIKPDDWENADASILASDIDGIIQFIAKTAKTLSVALPQDYSDENLKLLASLLERAEGVTEAVFDVKHGEKTNKIRFNKRITVHRTLINHIEQTIGAQSWDFE